MSTLPDFLGIGALKAGTSYLDAMLRDHPGLSLPPHVKEVQYFSAHYDRGPDWYAKQFDAPDGRPRGEVSPQYLSDPESARRIAAANPAARLITIVRHPVARAVSQYRHWVQETGYRSSFEDYLGEHPAAIDRSLYWSHLQRFRDVFPDEQLRVLVFEELVADPLPVLREVYGFLGVDPEHQPANPGEAVNASAVPRFPRLYVQVKRGSRWLRAHGGDRLVQRVQGSAAAKALSGRGDASRRAQAPPISEDARRIVADATRADTAALSDHLGRDLAALWRL